MGDTMKDDEKTREQLLIELTELRSQNAVQEKSVTGLTSTELAIEELHRYAESIVEAIRQPLLVLDADLKIVLANQYFYSTFKTIPGETLGSFIYDFGDKQWAIPELRELLEKILLEKGVCTDFEVSHDFEDIGQKIMLLNACQICRKDISPKLILLAIEDITERRRLDDTLKESEQRFRRVFETASDGILLLEKSEGKITHANPATEKMLGYTNRESIGKKFQDIGIFLDIVDFQATMQHLNEIGIINYSDVPITTKSGRHIDTDIYLVDRATLMQCNIRDVTERKQAETDRRESHAKLERNLKGAIDIISQTIETKGPYAPGHHRHVAALTSAIARELGLTDFQVQGIEIAAAVYDIGLMTIPIEFLQDSERLEGIKLNLYQGYPRTGHDALKKLEFPWPIAEIILQHRECYDGSGFPQGIRGEEILIEARILAVANALEDLTTYKSFRNAFPVNEALEKISAHSGSRYDPDVVDGCLRLFRGKGYRFEGALFQRVAGCV